MNKNGVGLIVFCNFITTFASATKIKEWSGGVSPRFRTQKFGGQQRGSQEEIGLEEGESFAGGEGFREVRFVSEISK